MSLSIKTPTWSNRYLTTDGWSVYEWVCQEGKYFYADAEVSRVEEYVHVVLKPQCTVKERTDDRARKEAASLANYVLRHARARYAEAI